MESIQGLSSSQKWQPKKIDLAIAAVTAVIFPIIAGLLYGTTGALLPMVLYYGIAWSLIKWRRGSTGYFNPFPKTVSVFFYLNVGVILFSLVCAYLARNIFPNKEFFGILITALIWAPLNAASEQLLWIYIFEAWDLYPSKSKLGYRLVGLILFSAFVGMIHTMYWAKFLTTVDSHQVFGVIFVILTSVSGFLHLVVWRKTNQMIFTFIPHFLLNLIPIFWTGYSILPFLFR
jgi:hypothetical protein